ncbi:MAG: hypothetical protein ACI8P3_003405 [Saprospiraceae bacterium]|jgi:hypothetical protein
MKKLILISSLFFVTFSFYAQVDSTSCSTIVLANDKEIPAFIHGIESGYLFYQRCRDTISHRYSIPVSYIKFIKGTRGFQDSLASEIVNLPELDPQKTKKERLKKWVFKENNSMGIIANTKRSVKEKQRVKVKYRDSRNKMRKVKGKWKTLTEEDLILDMRNGSTLMISRDDITKIDIIKNNFLIKLLAILIGVEGIVMLLIFSFALSLGIPVPIRYITLTLVLTLASGVIYLLTKPKSMDYPFNGEWEITSPSTEKNDVKEFYYQP